MVARNSQEIPARCMNGADLLILSVLVISMLLGLVRGFVREAIALLAWLGGMWLAWRYAPLLEPYLGGAVGDPPVSTWTARGLIVLFVLIVGWLVSAILSHLLQHSGLSILVDRVLGATFGVLRGAVVVANIGMVDHDRVVTRRNARNQIDILRRRGDAALDLGVMGGTDERVNGRREQDGRRGMR